MDYLNRATVSVTALDQAASDIIIIQSDVKAIQSNLIADVQSDLNVVLSNLVADVQSDLNVVLSNLIADVQSDITTLYSNLVATTDSDIVVIQSNLTVAKSDIVTILSNVTSFRSDIIAVTDSDIVVIQSNLTVAKSDIVTILSNVTSFRSDIIAVTDSDIVVIQSDLTILKTTQGTEFSIKKAIADKTTIVQAGLLLTAASTVGELLLKRVTLQNDGTVTGGNTGGALIYTDDATYPLNVSLTGAVFTVSGFVAVEIGYPLQTGKKVGIKAVTGDTTGLGSLVITMVFVRNADGATIAAV